MRWRGRFWFVNGVGDLGLKLKVEGIEEIMEILLETEEHNGKQAINRRFFTRLVAN
jgi:hypothetical protein